MHLFYAIDALDIKKIEYFCMCRFLRFFPIFSPRRFNPVCDFQNIGLKTTKKEIWANIQMADSIVEMKAEATQTFISSASSVSENAWASLSSLPPSSMLCNCCSMSSNGTFTNLVWIDGPSSSSSSSIYEASSRSTSHYAAGPCKYCGVFLVRRRRLLCT